MSPSPYALLEQRIAKLHRDYPGGDFAQMSAKDIAREEGCSPGTASERMRNFEYGALSIRNKRVVRCYLRGYIEYLRSKLVLPPVQKRGAA